MAVLVYLPLAEMRSVAADWTPVCRMWMLGPIQWINLIGWRKLQDFEVHAMFIYWREMSVMMGCKWVPNTLSELENFRLVRSSCLLKGLANSILIGFRG